MSEENYIHVKKNMFFFGISMFLFVSYLFKKNRRKIKSEGDREQFCKT